MSAHFSLSYQVNKRDQALNGCHVDIRHLGLARCLDLLRDRFYWPPMDKDIENYVRWCNRCLCFKQKHRQQSSIQLKLYIQMEWVHIDYLTTESGKSKMLILWLSQTIWLDMVRYSVHHHKQPKLPLKPVGEIFHLLWFFQKSSFQTSDKILKVSFFTELCQLVVTRKLRTTPYHP